MHTASLVQINSSFIDPPHRSTGRASSGPPHAARAHLVATAATLSRAVDDPRKNAKMRRLPPFLAGQTQEIRSSLIHERVLSTNKQRTLIQLARSFLVLLLPCL